MPTIMPVTDVRRALTSLIARLEKPIYITQHGRARAVLVDAGQFDEMLEEMEDLRLACDPGWCAEVARAREMARDEEAVRAAQECGDLVPLEKLEAEIASSAEEEEPPTPMAAYRVSLRSAAEKGLRKLPGEAQARILERLRQLAQNPRGQGCVKMNKSPRPLSRVEGLCRGERI